MANKEAEAARLRGEVQRLRTLQQQSCPDTPSTATDDPERNLDTAADTHGSSQTPADPVARQAVLDAAVAAKDKPTALVTQLQRCARIH